MIAFSIYVGDGESEWWEGNNKCHDHEDPVEVAKEIVHKWNKARPDSKREIIQVKTYTEADRLIAGIQCDLLDFCDERTRRAKLAGQQEIKWTHLFTHLGVCMFCTRNKYDVDFEKQKCIVVMQGGTLE